MNTKFKYCFKDGKLVQFDAHRECTPKNVQQKVNEIHFDGNKCKVLSHTGFIYKDINVLLSTLPASLISLDLSTKKYAEVIKILKNIIVQTKNVCLKLSNANQESLETGTNFVLEKLNKIDTLRKLKEEARTSPFYVEPEEIAIGLKWQKPKMNPETNIPSHKISQATYQYVPVIKTLNSIFSHDDFFRYYIKYNTELKHKCETGVYRDFCCGSTCKSNDVFEDDLALHLQLGIDDFEVCCPLKSKAGIHKVSATYLQIRNLPMEYRSKLDNIYLVALCTSANLKPENRSYNDIAERIVKEISVIETEGIAVGDRVLKGSLVNIACDILGANSVFGFTECFVANYFCRICECDKTECQSLTKSNEHKYRTKFSHEINAKEAERKNKKLDLKATKGVRRNSKFNDLQYFNVIENASVDVMHDINEGVIAYCLHDLFDHIINKKIISAEDIQRRVRDFNYTETHKKNKPSLINFDKPNLNQNASQFYCLFVNLPFIFFDLIQTFGEAWTPIIYLNKCLQIIYSTEITENDLKNLEHYIEHHLSAIMRIFNRTLTAKHHFFIHYPDIVRRMGPPIHLWTMRLEAKHKFFTETAQRKKNFKNPTKTMATHHQIYICKSPIISVDLNVSITSSQFSNSMQFKKFENILKNSFEKIDCIRVHKFATYGNIEYRAGNLLIENKKLNEIVHILSYGDQIYLLCEPQKVIRSDDFCHSLVLEKLVENAFVLDVKSIEQKLVYDKVIVDGETHVVLSNLLFRTIQ